MDNIEKKARIANIISLLFCILAILINYLTIITFFIIVFAIIQVTHIAFGDVTQSYKLLRKKRFLRIYVISLIIFSFLDLLILLVFYSDLKIRVYSLSILISFLADFLSNKTRVDRLNKNTLTNYQHIILKNAV